MTVCTGIKMKHGIELEKRIFYFEYFRVEIETMSCVTGIVVIRISVGARSATGAKRQGMVHQIRTMDLTMVFVLLLY